MSSRSNSANQPEVEVDTVPAGPVGFAKDLSTDVSNTEKKIAQTISGSIAYLILFFATSDFGIGTIKIVSQLVEGVSNTANSMKGAIVYTATATKYGILNSISKSTRFLSSIFSPKKRFYGISKPVKYQKRPPGQASSFVGRLIVAITSFSIARFFVTLSSRMVAPLVRVGKFIPVLPVWSMTLVSQSVMKVFANVVAAIAVFNIFKYMSPYIVKAMDKIANSNPGKIAINSVANVLYSFYMTPFGGSIVRFFDNMSWSLTRITIGNFLSNVLISIERIFLPKKTNVPPYMKKGKRFYGLSKPLWK